MADSPWSRDAALQCLDQIPADERLILPALQALQVEFGYVDADAVALVAVSLNVSVAEVHGVLTYYHELRSAPPAPIILAVCVAEACQANGSAEIVTHLEQTVAALGARSADGQVDVVEVFCLGNCALGPTALVNDRLLGRLTPRSVDRVLADAREAAR
jgi:formate dehydrogenase subunit gamma